MSLEEEIKSLRISIENLICVIGKLDHVKIDKNKLIPLSQWSKFHDYPSIASFRHIIFHEKTNGASMFVSRVGRKIYIDEEKFNQWVKTNPKF